MMTLTRFPNRGCQRTPQTPPETQAIKQRALIHADPFSPQAHRKSKSVVGQESIGAHVQVLLSSRGPSHVVRLVIGIGVDTVKRVMRAWPHANIRKERLETVAPFVADADTAPTVVGVLAFAGVIASLFHALPCSVLGAATSLSVRCMAVARRHQEHALSAIAAARSVVAQSLALQSLGRDRTDRAAITAAHPSEAAIWFGWAGMKHGPASKLSTPQVARSHMSEFYHHLVSILGES